MSEPSDLAPCFTGKYKKPQRGRLDKPRSAGQICERFIFLAVRTGEWSNFSTEVVGWYLVTSPHVAAEVRCKKPILDDEF